MSIVLHNGTYLTITEPDYTHLVSGASVGSLAGDCLIEVEANWVSLGYFLYLRELLMSHCLLMKILSTFFYYYKFQFFDYNSSILSDRRLKF